MQHEAMLDASYRQRIVCHVTVAGLTCLGGLALASPASAQESCFERLDNGVDLAGWQRSTTNHHGPGTGWTVEGGAMTGRQTAGQQGGILMTNKSYSDVEVVLEVKIDWGCDSGIFFRTTAGDRAYQVNVDHLTGGGVGTIYGESFTTELRQRDYTLSNMGNTATVEPGQTPIFDLAKWPTIWHPTAFNEIRARTEGNPPHIQVWLSGTKVMDFTDSERRSEINPTGPLAIQVHSGSRWVSGGTVQYRNIRARDLTVACAVAADAGVDARPVANQPDSSAPVDAASLPRPTADAGVDASPVANQPDSNAAVDAALFSQPIADAESAMGTGGTGGSMNPMTTAPADAAQDPGTGGSAALPAAAPASADSGGCACTTTRSASASAPPFLGAQVLFLGALAVLRKRYRAAANTRVGLLHK